MEVLVNKLMPGEIRLEELELVISQWDLRGHTLRLGVRTSRGD